MLHLIFMLNTMKILIKTTLNLKLVIVLRISKYKNIFAKGCTQNQPEEVFAISKIGNTVPQTYVISDLNDETIAGSFYKKELRKTSQKEYRVEKVIKRKDDKLYVKWKGYDNSFTSQIGKKDNV